MIGGYVGRILRIDLSHGKVKYENTPIEWMKAFIGGEGFAARLLYTELERGIDPLSPENKILFLTGPLVGTMAPSSGRYVVAFKSPLTGIWGVGHAGGHWGPELKYAGFDAVIIEGRAENPSYIWISDGEAEIRDAKQLWGRSVPETEEIIREETDREAKIVSIGQAGENLVKISNLISENYRGAGRGGAGAVFGSKNLKAVAVRGTMPIEVADPEKFYEASLKARRMIDENETCKGLHKYGTAVLVNVINEHGIFPTRNFQTGVFQLAEEISGENLEKTYLVGRRACAFCPIGCGRYSVVPSGRYATSGEGPEYESIWALGAQCGVGDLDAIIKANYLCNVYGLDPISVGSTIGCAMEAYERGYITDRDTGGLKLTFGNSEALVTMVEKIAKRDGFGNLLAEGSRIFSERIGHPELSMSVKGLELPAYDPRGAKGHGLAYATNNRGGCHLRAYMIASEILRTLNPMDRFSEDEGKVEFLKTLQDVTAVFNSLVICIFTSFAIGLSEVAPMLSAATGFEFTEKDLLKIGDRIYTLQRIFNVREGVKSKDDHLPKRLESVPMPEGPAKGHTVPIDRMLPLYYKVRGWDEDGKPKAEKIEELGLKEIVGKI